MKYLLLVYIDPELLDAVPAQDYDSEMRHCIRQADALRAQGTMLGFNKLQSPEQARTVRVREGRTAVFDGPFAETKELIAGFWIWQVKSLEEAIEWVKRCPNPMPGTEAEIEIRQVFEMEDFGENFTPELREQEEQLRRQIASKDANGA